MAVCYRFNIIFADISTCRLHIDWCIYKYNYVNLQSLYKKLFCIVQSLNDGTKITLWCFYSSFASRQFPELTTPCQKIQRFKLIWQVVKVLETNPPDSFSFSNMFHNKEFRVVRYFGWKYDHQSQGICEKIWKLSHTFSRWN